MAEELPEDQPELSIVEEFPNHLGWWVDDGKFLQEAPSVKRFLGDRAQVITRGKMPVTFHVRNQINLNALFKWWVNNLDSGAKRFTTAIPYMGNLITRDVEYLSTIPFVAQNTIDGGADIKFVLVPVEDNDYQAITKPARILDLLASKDNPHVIEITFTDVHDPLITNNLMSGDTLIASNISSGYLDYFIGARSYSILSSNRAGIVLSNMSEGNSLVPIEPITTLNATTTELHKVIFTHSDLQPFVEWDLYSGTTKIATNIKEPFSLDVITAGTEYHLKGKRDSFTAESNKVTGVSILPIPPITNFVATKNIVREVKVTFYDGEEHTIYDLYSGTTLVEANIRSGYVDVYIGARDYYIKAKRDGLSSNSNIDSGNSIIAPKAVTGLTATTDVAHEIEINFKPPVDTQYVTFDLYRDSTLVKADIKSGFVDYFVGTAEYYVISNRDGLSKESLRVVGNGLVPPVAVTDFTASVDTLNAITMNFTDTHPYTKYKLYNELILIKDDVRSGYVDIYDDVKSYHIVSERDGDTAVSNISFGSGKVTLPSIKDFKATTSPATYTTITFTFTDDEVDTTYAIYSGSTVVLSGASSGDTVDYDGGRLYHVKATRNDQVISSNTSYATGTSNVIWALPQQNVEFNLMAVVTSGLGVIDPRVKSIRVVNDFVQPTLNVGSIPTALTYVELLNKNELQGAGPGKSGLVITTSARGRFKLINGGSIKGAGGRGADGGQGFKGNEGTWSTHKNITWTRYVSWPSYSTGEHKRHDGEWVDFRAHGWRLYGVVDSYLYYSSPCGYQNSCGVWVNVTNRNRRGRNQRYVGLAFGGGSHGFATAATISGHAGGAGGVGGAGGAGGEGEHFRHAVKNGVAGKPGLAGSPGGRNHYTDGNGHVHYGNYGGRGEVGKAGTKGANGGWWGRGGYSTWNQPNPPSPGSPSIVGSSFLYAGSSIGSVEGDVR